MLPLYPHAKPVIIKKTLCFDIGANIGQFLAVNHSNFDKIISVEPVVETYNILKNNISKYPHIIPLNYAVCNNNGEDVKFYNCLDDSCISSLNKEWIASPLSRFHYLNNSQVEIVCKSITIDKLIETYGMPDLIKIDVECGEYECISSLNIKNDLLCFEWASEFNEISFKCIDHLEKIGYTKFYIQDKDYYDFRPTDDQFYSSITAKNLLLTTIPKIHWGMIWCK